MKDLKISDALRVAGGVDGIKIPIVFIKGPVVTVPDINISMAPIQGVPSSYISSPCSAAAFGNAASGGAGEGGVLGYEAADQAAAMGDPSDNGAAIIAGNMAAGAITQSAVQLYRCVASRL